MGRITNPLTGTQLDEELFEEMRAKLKAIGMRQLATYGLISHETIKNYCLRRPVAPDSERLIFESIAKHNKHLETEAETSKQKARELLTA